MVTLREGVTSHDGVLMEATAVKASLERAIGLSKTAKTLLGVADIPVQSPLTLSITHRARRRTCWVC